MQFDHYLIVEKLNGEKSELVKQVSHCIRSAMVELGIKMFPVKSSREKMENYPNLIIFALGGDGTMLHAMRLSTLNGATSIGVNLGRVGFLTDVNLRPDYLRDSDLIDHFKNVIIDTESTVTERILLTNNVHENELAANEYVVSAPESYGMLEYDLFIDGKSAGHHRANGVIVSTPTGSTAYSLSAGGALMYPSMQAIQITPIAAMSMSSRPIVINATSNVTIMVNQEAHLICDGQRIHKSGGKASFKFGAHDVRARVLHNEGWNFFEVLTHKLGWNNK